MIKNRLTLLLMALVFIITACSKKHPTDMGPTIAKVGNEYIYLYDVISPKDSVTFFRRGLDFRKKQITNYVMRDMYVKEGYSRGLHKNDAIVKKMDDFVKINMVNFVYRGVVLDKFANKDARRNLYNKLKKQVSGRHILITYIEALNAPTDITRSKEEALEVLADIRLKINNSEDFISFADEVSEDQTSVDGGNLGFFEWGQMEDAFQEAAFSLPTNTLSELVETSYGFHLLWIDSIKIVELEPFDKMEGQLRNRLYTLNNEIMIKTAEAFVDSLNREAGTIINTDRIRKLVENISTFIKANSSGSKDTSPVSFLEEQRKYGSLANYNGKEVSIQALIDLIKNHASRMTISTLADTSIVKKIVVGEVNKSLLTKYGFDEKYDKKPELTKERKAKERASVWQEIREIEINGMLNENENNIQTYYNEHKDNYLTKRKSDIIEILISDKNIADSLYALVSHGSDISELAVRHSIRKNVGKTLGIINGVTKLQMGAIGKALSLMNVGDLSEPLNVGKNWSLFKVIFVTEPEYQPIENVRRKLLVSFRNDEKKRLKEVFESYLISKYNPQYYFENLDTEVAEGTIE